MQAVGIVAEYNPFHSGHQYHIAQTRAQLSDADGIIAVMSGNFTQRGEPAVFDKWTRSKTALYGGADLVLELPTVFATRSAGYFAQGAVLTLAHTGIVSHLSCGIESSAEYDTAQALQQIAAILCDEPTEYQTALQKYLKLGSSYPSARKQALRDCHIIGTDLLDTPNNILALEYLLNIAQENLPITPILIARAGNYHAEQIPENTQQFASATAIRKLLLENDNLWQNQMPKLCTQTLMHKLSDGYHPMHMDRFWQNIMFLLRRMTVSEMQSIIDVSEGLENRILEAVHMKDITTVADLCMAIKSKRYAYTRIQRTLLHILLNFTREYEAKEPAYIRVLSFNATGQKLLKEMKKKAELPILIRPARQKQELTAHGQKQLELDIRATDLYHMGYSHAALHKVGLDYLQMPIQI